MWSSQGSLAQDKLFDMSYTHTTTCNWYTVWCEFPAGIHGSRMIELQVPRAWPGGAVRNAASLQYEFQIHTWKARHMYSASRLKACHVYNHMFELGHVICASSKACHLKAVRFAASLVYIGPQSGPVRTRPTRPVTPPQCSVSSWGEV